LAALVLEEAKDSSSDNAKHKDIAYRMVNICT